MSNVLNYLKIEKIDIQKVSLAAYMSTNMSLINSTAHGKVHRRPGQGDAR